MKIHNKYPERIGETRKNRHGSEMLIEEYISCRDIKVKFIKYDFSVRTTYQNFINGKIKCPYDKSVHNHGYIGVGQYKPKIDGKMSQQYMIWSRMISRCYSEDSLSDSPTYLDVSVCDDWLNFQNFAKWYDENYYEVEGERMHLDKDILVKGNRVYSPDTCVFVPQVINLLFVKGDALRGELPIGVSINKSSKVLSYQAFSSNTFLGCFPTKEQAFKQYKLHKECHIKTVAKVYKERINPKLYDTMMKYEVEIFD